MAVRIGCVVEGHGECESVPILVRRIAGQFDPGLAVQIPHPVRVTKSKLLKAGELERAVELAAITVGGNGAILVILDSDDDCPARTRSGPTCKNADRKSTRLNSSHLGISYAVFCLK